MGDRIPAFLTTELGYVALLFTLFVLPRVLQRWRIPTAITALGLGAAAGAGFGLFTQDATVHLLASFGIVALFLFAGLDVDVERLGHHAGILARHLLTQGLLLAAGTAVFTALLGLPARPAVLVALAVVTPSAGFILDALDRTGLPAGERRWLADTVISSEFLALAVLFVSLQSASIERLAFSTLALVALVAVLPSVFRVFASRIAPFAPKSEFAFLLMMALLCAYATRQLGVYYLVGAFVVGIAARRFREDLPAMASEQMLHAIEVFAVFFVPFYFFSAGTTLRSDDFSPAALGLGALLVAVALPLRVGVVALLRKLAFREPFRQSVRTAVPMLPTLVFTLVIAGILREQFAVDASIIGALVIYTVLNTALPGLVLGAPVPDYDSPELPPARHADPDDPSPAGIA